MDEQLIDQLAKLADRRQFMMDAQWRQLVRDLIGDRGQDLEKALTALTELLAVANIVTLADPTKHRVADTVALPALIARSVLESHGRLDDLAKAVQAHMTAQPS